MAFPYQLHETKTLIGVMQMAPEVPSYFLSNFFTSQVNATTEYIDFEKIGRERRRIAPYVMPLAKGRPVYSRRSTPSQFKPAYIKLNDTYDPQRALARRPGQLLTPVADSPEANYQAWVVDCAAQQRRAIERRWEHQAAMAILNGSVTISGPDYPAQVIDYGRPAGHTITLGSGSRWGDPGVSIIDSIQTWSDLMHAADFGGAPNRLTIGVKAWAVMRKDREVIDQLDLQRRGSQADIVTGLLPTGEIKYAGTLATGLEVYVYNDYIHADAGNIVRLMDERDVLLTGPAIEGVRAFGAILDVNAQFQALEIFSRLFMENDPAIPTMLSQSAPLMVPLNPAATLRARVVG